jgi:hypothetical protein
MKTAKKQIGQKTKYTPELAREMCEKLSDGIPLRVICRSDPKYPVWQKVYEWMWKDAELAGAIAKAREVGQDAIAEDIFLLSEKPPERIEDERGNTRVDSGYVQWVKVQADIKLKLLAKWNPKRYGDRVAVSGVEGGAPITIDHGIFDALLTNIELKRQISE